MPPVRIDELAFIDDTDDTKSNEEEVFEKLGSRVQTTQSSPQFVMVLRLQKLARLYEKTAKVHRRIQIIKDKVKENENINRFEKATIELLRAERKRKVDNISDLGLKIVDCCNSIEAYKFTSGENREAVSKQREEQVQEAKKLLQAYMKISDPKPIINGQPKALPSTISKNLTGKQKRLFVEAENRFELANIARFASVSAVSLGHCLRILPGPTSFGIIKDGPEGRPHLITYDDPRAREYLCSILDELNNLRLVRKSKGLINFIEDKSASKFSATPVKLAVNQKVNLMRNDLFSRTTKSTKTCRAMDSINHVPDLT